MRWPVHCGPLVQTLEGKSERAFQLRLCIDESHKDNPLKAAEGPEMEVDDLLDLVDLKYLGGQAPAALEAGRGKVHATRGEPHAHTAASNVAGHGAPCLPKTSFSFITCS